MRVRDLECPIDIRQDGPVRQAAIFFALTLLISGGIILVAWRIDNEGPAILAVLVPSAVAIVLTYRFQGRYAAGRLLKLHPRGNPAWRWVVLAFFLFPILAGAAVLVAGVIDDGIPAMDTGLDNLPVIIIILIISFGEELGWRGYALPRLLQRYGPLIAGLVVGGLWALWHGPAALIGTDVPLDTPFWLFTVWVLAGSVIMTMVYVRTNAALWLMIVMHSMANASFVFLPLLPENSGQQTGFRVFAILAVLAATVLVLAGWRSGIVKISNSLNDGRFS